MEVLAHFLYGRADEEGKDRTSRKRQEMEEKNRKEQKKQKRAKKRGVGRIGNREEVFGIGRRDEEI